MNIKHTKDYMHNDNASYLNWIEFQCHFTLKNPIVRLKNNYILSCTQFNQHIGKESLTFSGILGISSPMHLTSSLDQYPKIQNDH